jgi:hypothetical protein
MSISPLTIVIFLAAAIAVKISVLIAIALAAFRRFDRWPVYGVWYLVGGDGRGVDIASAGRPPLALIQGLDELLARNVSRMEITRSGDTITLRSADGRPFSYGGTVTRVTRSVKGGVQVDATWDRLGDAMKLQSEVSGSATVIETYSPAGKELDAEFRVSVKASGIDEVFVRRFRRSSQGR